MMCHADETSIDVHPQHWQRSTPGGSGCSSSVGVDDRASGECHRLSIRLGGPSDCAFVAMERATEQTNE